MSRILFATSNGTGLGHLTRGMAIARRLPDSVQPLFLTLSQAMPVTVQEGFFAEFLCSYEYGNMDGRHWNTHYQRRMEHVLDMYEPDLVVFDGVYPYLGLIRAIRRRSDTRFIWCRRAMWKAQTGVEHLRDTALFREVLEPGEYAEDADQGPTVPRRHEAHRVAPIVYLGADELLDRAEAAQALGLDPTRPAVLVQLGSGSVSTIETTAGRVVERLLRVPDLQVTVAESVISGASMDLPDGVHRARVYPLARYNAAFDFAVAAPGYNLFHEALAYGMPTLFVPKLDSTRDDQEGRARWAAQHGVGLAWDAREPDALDGALGPLLNPDTRAEMSDALRRLAPASGAQEAADWLADLVDRTAPTDTATTPTNEPVAHVPQ